MNVLRSLPREPWAIAAGGACLVGLAWLLLGGGRVWPVSKRHGILSGFGVSRPGGRLHAGADVGALVGDAILAIEDGVVLHRVSGFGIFGSDPPPGYQPLEAIAIRHSDADYIYAEIRLEIPATPGLRVRRGQRIGRAARNGDGNSMLHLEAWARGSAPKGFVPWSASGPRPAGLLDVGRRLAAIA